jgi:pimeloyl-ACP methyl ester carboxylesterase
MSSLPSSLQTLVDRFDVSAFDAPQGQARIRLIGAKGFWTRLATLEPLSLFIWGKRDRLVPVAFAAHVKQTLPAARHLELDCGHVPQLERPAETQAAIAPFLQEGGGA